jgi:hypothetical protein
VEAEQNKRPESRFQEALSRGWSKIVGKTMVEKPFLAGDFGQKRGQLAVADSTIHRLRYPSRSGLSHLRKSAEISIDRNLTIQGICCGHGYMPAVDSW